MPNIIEQQDLLKGLPDDSLSMLMQNPTGDIPPFLVAAEAQRRQSIREQFSGGPQESVVDTLTKQLASVPQNIEAPMQTPPQMPPPQMQAGIDALQQGMRRGGFVQRYQDGSLVQTMAQRFGTRYPTVEELSSMSPEELSALREYQGAAADKRLRDISQITGGRYGQGLEWQRDLAESRASGPLSQYYSPETVVDSAKKLKELPSEAEMQSVLAGESSLGPTYNPGTMEPSKYGMSASDRKYAPVTKPRDETAAQDDSSEDNKDAAEKAALRKRLEELYGKTEVSDWEKAQKWFAAAQAAIKPGQSNWEATINALSALGSGAAEERAAEREALIAREKAMLEWDMSQYDADRKERAAIAADTRAYERELAKMNILSPADAVKGYVEELKLLDAELNADTPPSEDRRAQILSEMNGLRTAIATVRKGVGYGAGGVSDMNTMRQLAAGQ